MIDKAASIIGMSQAQFLRTAAVRVAEQIIKEAV